MERLTLRDAAERTGLSVTTLRRYIRSGKLHADKTPGRYGPEYTLSIASLEQAGVGVPAGNGGPPPAPPSAGSTALAAPQGSAAQPPAAPRAGWLPENLLREVVPVDLFRELAMKHEQLLVQYGMVRVGGQKLMEYKSEAERLDQELGEVRDSAKSERDRYAQEVGFLKKHLRQAELEIEQRNQEIAALQEKVRILELLSRNAIMTESIEHQFLKVLDKRLELEEMHATSSDERRRKMAALEEVLRTGFRARPDENPTDQ